MSLKNSLTNILTNFASSLKQVLDTNYAAKEHTHSGGGNNSVNLGDLTIPYNSIIDTAFQVTCRPSEANKDSNGDIILGEINISHLIDNSAMGQYFLVIVEAFHDTSWIQQDLGNGANDNRTIEARFFYDETMGGGLSNTYFFNFRNASQYMDKVKLISLGYHIEKLQLIITGNNIWKDDNAMFINVGIKFIPLGKAVPPSA